MAELGATMPVDDSPRTRASLLVQIRDGGNREAWQEFMRIYGPVVYGFARKRGLQDADAADLMQDVMRRCRRRLAASTTIPIREPFAAGCSRLRETKSSRFSPRRNKAQSSGDSATSRLLDEQPDPNDGSAEWELEYQRGWRRSPWNTSSTSFKRILGGHFG